MNYIDLLNDIDKKKLANIVLIHVREKYLYDIAINSLKNDYLNRDFVGLNFTKLDFEKLDKASFVNAIETLPLMDEKKVVLVEDLPLEKDKAKKYSKQLEIIEGSFKDFNDRTSLILTFSGDKIYKTGKFAKKLLKNAKTYDIDRLDRRQFNNFIVKYFAKNKVNLDLAKADLISSRLSYLEKDSRVNLFDVENELNKLLNNIGSGKPSLKEIEETVIEHFQDNIFAFTDALSNKRVKDAMTLLYRMDEDDYYMAFHMMLRQVKNLLCIKDCSSNRINKSETMKICMVGPYEYDKNSKFMRNFTLDQLLDIHKACFEAEKRVKTTGADIKDELRKIIASFSF